MLQCVDLAVSARLPVRRAGSPSWRARYTVRARSSNITAAFTASPRAVGPTAKTPWLAIRTAGERCCDKVCTRALQNSSPPIGASGQTGMSPPSSPRGDMPDVRATRPQRTSSACSAQTSWRLAPLWPGPAGRFQSPRPRSRRLPGDRRAPRVRASIRRRSAMSRMHGQYIHMPIVADRTHSSVLIAPYDSRLPGIPSV